MKRAMILTVAVAISTHAYAATDHYLRRDGGHVQHLKITTIDGEINASIDVDFEPTAAELARGVRPCSVDLEGEVRKTGDNTLVLRKQIPGEAHYCLVEITLEGDSAKTSQSGECRYFLANFCKFESEGQPLMKIK